MKLLCELNEQVEYITESEGDKKFHCLSGVFMEADVVNRNGRFYETKILAPEVARYVAESVAVGSGWGELGHPEKPNMNLDRICIRITELNQNKNQFIGKARICENNMGHVVKSLLECGGRIGVSSRALGSLVESEKGYKLVAPDLRLLAVDVVADPSAPNAYVESIMESTEWVYDEKLGWKAVEIVNEQKEQLKKMNLREINENKVRLFEDFIASLTAKK